MGYYKLKTYLNASHFIWIGHKEGEPHSHTWQFTIQMNNRSDRFVSFEEMETMVGSLFDSYQNCLLNQTDVFIGTNPTLEQICIKFGGLLKQKLKEADWELLSLECSETPLRSYVFCPDKEENPAILEREEEAERLADSLLFRLTHD